MQCRRPLALVGATPPAAALAAANKVVKAKGRMSLHCGRKGQRNAHARPARRRREAGRQSRRTAKPAAAAKPKHPGKAGKESKGKAQAK